MFDVIKIRLMFCYGRVVDAHRAIIDHCNLCNINCFEIQFRQNSDNDNKKACTYGENMLQNICDITLVRVGLIKIEQDNSL